MASEQSISKVRPPCNAAPRRCSARAVCFHTYWLAVRYGAYCMTDRPIKRYILISSRSNCCNVDYARMARHLKVRLKGWLSQKGCRPPVLRRGLAPTFAETRSRQSTRVSSTQFESGSMYTTFAANSGHEHREAHAAKASTSKQHSKADRASLNYVSPASTSWSTTETRRPKRNQVARACDSCRINRIKCDEYQPCNACRSRGEQCSNTGKFGLLTSPTATKQVLDRFFTGPPADSCKGNRKTRGACSTARERNTKFTSARHNLIEP